MSTANNLKCISNEFLTIFPAPLNGHFLSFNWCTLLHTTKSPFSHNYVQVLYTLIWNWRVALLLKSIFFIKKTNYAFTNFPNPFSLIVYLLQIFSGFINYKFLQNVIFHKLNEVEHTKSTKQAFSTFFRLKNQLNIYKNKLRTYNFSIWGGGVFCPTSWKKESPKIQF